jgi:intein/homing endonuclease
VESVPSKQVYLLSKLRHIAKILKQVQALARVQKPAESQGKKALGLIHSGESAINNCLKRLEFFSNLNGARFTYKTLIKSTS